MSNGVKYNEEEEVALLEATSHGHQIIVYNDDHNTFDWVIKCFMEICGHSSAQAEQLSMLVHFKGKASVKQGTFEDLKPMKDALCDRGLSAVIESVDD